MSTLSAQLRLSDTDVLVTSSAAMDDLLFSIGERVDDQAPELAKWLKDVAERPAPFMDFDIRGFSAAHRAAFWLAARQLWSERVAGAADHDGSAIGRLLRMEAAMDTEEPEVSKSDLIDLTEIWDARERLVFRLPPVEAVRDQMLKLADGRVTREEAQQWARQHLPPEVDPEAVKLRLHNENVLRYVHLLAAATTRAGSDFMAELADFRTWAAEMPPA